ncbi:MAG: FtsX-like permease family protein [Vicinamibacterales bacterium]
MSQRRIVRPSGLRFERTLDDADEARDSLNQERVIAMLSGCLAGLALLLAALGLYGVTAYTVTRRRAEIGVRMALGARQMTIMRLVLTRVAILLGVGVALGSAASLALSQSVTTLLYGLALEDYRVLTGASKLLLVVAVLASGLPAWRAAHVDPLKALGQNQ